MRLIPISIITAGMVITTMSSVAGEPNKLPLKLTDKQMESVVAGSCSGGRSGACWDFTILLDKRGAGRTTDNDLVADVSSARPISQGSSGTFKENRTSKSPIFDTSGPSSFFDDND